MAHLSLSAVGVDQPGIVAAVSGVLVDLGCNLEDSTMSILQGQFAMVLVVANPEGVDAGRLEEALAPVAARFGLVVVVRPFVEVEGGEPAGHEPWTVSVHGGDRIGIVHAVASALAEEGGNVVDLSTHLVGGADAPLYVMTVRATLPAGSAGVAAAARVEQAATALGVRCTVHRDDADVL